MCDLEKDAVVEMQDFLNSIVTAESLHSVDILEVSRELDKLILYYYSKTTSSLK